MEGKSALARSGATGEVLACPAEPRIQETAVDGAVLKSATLKALAEVEDHTAALGLALKMYGEDLDGKRLAELLAAVRAVAKRLGELRATLPGPDGLGAGAGGVGPA
jgi:hypothetical protein